MFNLDPSGDNSVLQRLSSKRKLDDYGGVSDDDFSDLVSVRMKKVESAVNSWSPSADHGGVSSALGARVPDARSACSSSSSSYCRAGSSRSASTLQFFVRMMSEGKTMVVQADCDDSVKSLHERIQLITGIPVSEQRLIYRGKQLQWEQSLAECAIQNDAGLQLVGRMRSTEHPLAWQAMDDIISSIWQLCKDKSKQPMKPPSIRSKLLDFLKTTPRNDIESAAGHLQILLSSSAPAALVMLYSSQNDGNKEIADDAIRGFLSSISASIPRPMHSQCAPIVLEFCKLLRLTVRDDPLYLSCRSVLGSLLLLDSIGFSRCSSSYTNYVKGPLVFKDIIPFISETANRLSENLVTTEQAPGDDVLFQCDVQDFSAFVFPLRNAIYERWAFRGPISVPLQKSLFDHPYCEEEIELLHCIFNDLLKRMEHCLREMELSLNTRSSGSDEITYSRCPHYLALLKELSSISKLYKGTEKQFWDTLRKWKVAVCALVLKYAKRGEDNGWILEHKDVTNFESRRHLVMMLLPDVKDEYEELHEMLIDRSQLLAESFEYIGRAEADVLHAGLFMEFKNEEATGPGVLREWFLLVSQAIFNPQNALFVACPNDRRRFYPNPASRVDPLHLEYFRFSGRVVALALMHKVQIGIVLDRAFYLQLAGGYISLDDIRDADPEMHHSCKKVLEMDADFMDSDALGLTFVTEFEELGSRKVVELCPGGQHIVVTSWNRKDYVNLLIQHRFVTSISEQVSHFSKGFSDIMCDSSLQKLFFKSLELEDLDSMLYGSESDISVEDWKAHTEYNGYKRTDPQISWFWEIVGKMSAEQRRVLLFFWTSIKYLPVDGFGGLASRLHLYKSTEPLDRLPSSHTCFYRLCFPPYPSMAVMQDRLRVVTQEHVGCSFGTW